MMIFYGQGTGGALKSTWEPHGSPQASPGPPRPDQRPLIFWIGFFRNSGFLAQRLLKGCAAFGRAWVALVRLEGSHEAPKSI